MQPARVGRASPAGVSSERTRGRSLDILVKLCMCYCSGVVRTWALLTLPDSSWADVEATAGSAIAACTLTLCETSLFGILPSDGMRAARALRCCMLKPSIMVVRNNRCSSQRNGRLATAIAGPAFQFRTDT